MSVYNVKAQKIKKIAKKHQNILKKYGELYNASIKQLLEGVENKKITEIKARLKQK